MDSRVKIGAVVPERATVVRGHFDPLLAAHAARLGGFPRPLAAIVDETPLPLLPLDARRAMVAALRCVDCVLTEGDAEFDLTAEHDALKAEFLRQVKARADG